MKHPFNKKKTKKEPSKKDDINFEAFKQTLKQNLTHYADHLKDDKQTYPEFKETIKKEGNLKQHHYQQTLSYAISITDWIEQFYLSDLFKEYINHTTKQIILYTGSYHQFNPTSDTRYQAQLILRNNKSIYYQETKKEHPNSKPHQEKLIQLTSSIDLAQTLDPHFVRAVYESINTGLIWLNIKKER